jgi:hypothetical protein
MDKIKWGVIGGGQESMIGEMHRLAASMNNEFELVGGVFSRHLDKSRLFANSLGLDHGRVYVNVSELVEKEHQLEDQSRMKAVSVLTPNYLHYEQVSTLLKGGFHVICEKPFTVTHEEAVKLHELSTKTNKQVAITYTYTGYPMVRQMKSMITEGSVGTIQKVDVQYYQGWINPIIQDKHKVAETWRLQPEQSGLSSCIADIGTHAFDLAEYLTGMEVESLLADLNYFAEEIPLDLDGTILVRFDASAKGVIRASQIATGEDNNLTVAIYGQKGYLKWQQEHPEYLEFALEGHPIQILKRGKAYNSALSKSSTKIPEGHPEGIFEAMGNIYHGFAKSIKGETFDPSEFPSLHSRTTVMMCGIKTLR